MESHVRWLNTLCCFIHLLLWFLKTLPALVTTEMTDDWLRNAKTTGKRLKLRRMDVQDFRIAALQLQSQFSARPKQSLCCVPTNTV